MSTIPNNRGIIKQLIMNTGKDPIDLDRVHSILLIKIL
jgi:hypothetical protein